MLLLDILQRLRMSKLEFTDQLKLSIYSMPWHRLAAALTSCSYFAAQCSWMPTDERKRKFHVVSSTVTYRTRAIVTHLYNG